MWNRNIVSIDWVASFDWLGRGGKVGDDLVAKEVEVDPSFTAASFWESQHLAVKMSGCCEVRNGKSKMEWC